VFKSYGIQASLSGANRDSKTERERDSTGAHPTTTPLTFREEAAGSRNNENWSPAMERGGRGTPEEKVGKPKQEERGRKKTKRKESKKRKQNFLNY
jgi:hypothetical protein